MAGLGFKDFQVGEVLTSSDVDGYLMAQAVMRFADSGARGSALGTAVGTAVALAEGMISYLNDTNSVEIYDGTSWSGVGVFNAGTAITATDASWSVPALANPVVRVTVIGGGGGGATGGQYVARATNGSSSVFGSGESWAVTAAGGDKGDEVDAAVQSADGRTAEVGFVSGNHGRGNRSSNNNGQNGTGGRIVVGYVDLTGVTTVNVVVGAGGSGATQSGSIDGSAGGDGVVIVEYRAG